MNIESSNNFSDLLERIYVTCKACCLFYNIINAEKEFATIIIIFPFFKVNILNINSDSNTKILPKCVGDYIESAGPNIYLGFC